MINCDWCYSLSGFWLLFSMLFFKTCFCQSKLGGLVNTKTFRYCIASCVLLPLAGFLSSESWIYILKLTFYVYLPGQGAPHALFLTSRVGIGLNEGIRVLGHSCGFFYV